jgi:hypothetical protein
MVTQKNVRLFSNVLMGLGFLSIVGALAAWISTRASGGSHEEQSEGQRMANFIGLWPPTFFILSSVLDRMAERRM